MARYDDDFLNDVYDRTDGRCHVCRKKLAFTNHGRVGARGAWEVDHSRARARGGSDFLGNYLPACIPCNRKKGARTNRSVRRPFGYRCRPLSRKARREARAWSALIGGGGLGLIARAALGPAALLPGIVLGAIGGYNLDPDSR